MKIRQGFVSNSSSSSFCILGIVRGDKNQISEDVAETLDSGEGLERMYGISDYYEQQLLGMSPSQMKDDETLLQFKQRIVDEFKKYNVTVSVEDLDWHTDGGYDG